jgi:asparagine synthase (glutamine-hydrolysing)
MCGISGFINFDNNKIDVEVLNKMLEYQVHRGPDASGIYYNNYVGFAHNRLSLLDLSSNGNQPFEKDNFVLTYNGEIYNYLELKKQLPDYQYKSTSDTEVLFNALKEWGVEKTVKKLQGMFAFSWYDKTKNELTLVRDRLGIKPLFFAFDSEKNYFFASELKSILVASKFDVNYTKVLYSSLGILEKSRKETAWENISLVKPGHFVTISSKGLIEQEYYNIIDTVSEAEYNRFDKMKMSDVLPEFDTLFSDSVKKMLISDASMGAFVSGGIDSSLIATYAKRHNSNIKLFTANVLGKYSEFEDAKLLAKSLELPLYDYKFEKEMALRDWAKVTWHYESPVVVHFNAMPFSNVSMLTREHNVKAVLTGEGADELFLGYPKLLTRRYDQFIKLPYNFLNTVYGKIPKLREYVSKTGGSQDLHGVFDLASQNFTRQMIREKSIDKYGFLNPKKQKEQYLTAQMLQEGIVSLLWRNDRMGMIHSVESRFPFLDETILAFAMNLPSKFKIGYTNKFYNYKHPFLIDKLIVRKLAENKLPNQLVYKKKNGFPVYSLRNTHVHPDFFIDGVVQKIFNLTNDQLNYMCRCTNNYNTALLASVEIWAKLFIKNESIETVTEEIFKYIQIK